MAMSGDMLKAARVKGTMHGTQAAPQLQENHERGPRRLERWKGNCLCKERNSRETEHIVSPFIGMAVHNPYLRTGEGKTDFKRGWGARKSWRKRSETTWGWRHPFLSMYL